jgi:hypothetical protein
MWSPQPPNERYFASSTSLQVFHTRSLEETCTKLNTSNKEVEIALLQLLTNCNGPTNRARIEKEESGKLGKGVGVRTI